MLLPSTALFFHSTYRGAKSVVPHNTSSMSLWFFGMNWLNASILTYLSCRCWIVKYGFKQNSISLTSLWRFAPSECFLFCLWSKLAELQFVLVCLLEILCRVGKQHSIYGDERQVWKERQTCIHRRRQVSKISSTCSCLAASFYSYIVWVFFKFLLNVNNITTVHHLTRLLVEYRRKVKYV